MDLNALPIISAILIPLFALTFYLSGRLTTIESTIKGNKTEIMGSLRLMMSDERIVIEKKFDEIEKSVALMGAMLETKISTERHKLNNIDMKVRGMTGYYRKEDRP